MGIFSNQSKKKKSNVIDNGTKTRYLKILYPLLFFITGIALILLSIVFEHSKSSGYLIQLFSHLGVGFIILGIVGIVIDFKHWRDYFEDRLSKIVIDKKYLEKLTPTDLISLQTEVLKAYFKNEQISGENGFLNFYQNHIQSYIASPYRINVNSYYQIQFSQENKDFELFEIKEMLSFTCKANGGKIQPIISWVPDIDEYKESIFFEVTLSHESFDSIVFTKEDLRNRGFLRGDELGFEIPLADHVTCDNLHVTIKSHYKMRSQRFIGWRMNYPTRGLSLTLQFPAELVVSYEYFFTENNRFRTSYEPHSGYFNLTIDDWIMPDEGMSIQLLKDKEVSHG